LAGAPRGNGCAGQALSVAFGARAIYRNFLTVVAPLFDDSDSEQEEGSNPATSERPAYETGTYASGTRARRSRTLSGNDRVVLLTKMRSLSVREPSYLVLYSHCQQQFPDIPQNLPISELFQAPTPSSVFFYSSGAPTMAPATVSPLPPLPQFLTRKVRSLATGKARESAAAPSVVRLGTASTVTPQRRNTRTPPVPRSLTTALPPDRPTQPIPNDGLGLGLQVSVDAWLNDNKQLL